MGSHLESYIAALNEPSGQKARIEFCRQATESLRVTGSVLWAYGLSDSSARRALATTIQMAASLTAGTCALLEVDNWYGSAALLRQVVEIEYLLWLFSVEPTETQKWLSATQGDLRRLYSPAAMRKKSAGRFRDTEYWSHCEIGGHPNPKAGFLLDGHTLPGDRSPLGSPSWLWVDLGQHLERLWRFAEAGLRANALADVGSISAYLLDISLHVSRWHAADPCAARLDEAIEWKVDRL